MAESTLSVTKAILQRRIAVEMGWNRTVASWSANQATDGADILDDALRRVYYPPPHKPNRPAHQWSFLRPVTSLTTTASYSTGTVTIVAGVVTLASGTFPADSVNMDFIYSSVPYTVASRDSGSQVTLSDTSVTAAAGSSYELAYSAYDLPDLFAGFDGPLTYRAGQGTVSEVVITDEAYLRKMHSAYVTTGYPVLAAQRPKTFTAATGQRWQVVFEPYANEAYVFNYRYKINPNQLGTGEYPMGGMPLAQLFVAACRAACESHLNGGGEGPRFAEYMRALSASVDWDVQSTAPETLGCDNTGHAFDEDNEAYLVDSVNTVYYPSS